MTETAGNFQYTYDADDKLPNGHVCQRLHKSSCCEDACPPCNCLFHCCRKAVSGHKVRYEKDDFDLDMTYLDQGERILVHGFPAIGCEHMYRNPRYHLKAFLDERHKDQYFVFNFCCEPGRGYDASVFEGRVKRFPFKDHNTPLFDTIIRFGEFAKRWLDQDPKNICSLHCKAGKGRAGLMSCILLIRSGICQNAKEALDLYDNTRVDNREGLTVTSQRKYVIFYELIWRQYYNEHGDIGSVPGAEDGVRKVPHQPELHIDSVSLLNCSFDIRKMRIVIYQGTNVKPKPLFDTADDEAAGDRPLDQTTFDTPCSIKGNFKIHIEHKPSFFGKKKKLCEFWHNTLFVDKGVLVADFKADQLDIDLKKDKTTKKKTNPMGDAVTLRIKFNKTKAADGDRDISAMDVSASAGEYEMVARGGDADEEEA